MQSFINNQKYRSITNQIRKMFKKTSLSIILTVCLSIVLIGQDRSFKDIELKLIADITLADHDLFKVHSLEINDIGDIVFFDFGENRIVKTQVDNLIFELLGNGKGRGPKEFVQVMDVKITNREILLSDREKSKIIIWNLNGEFKKEVKLEGRFIKPSRVAICNDMNSIYLLSSQYSPDGIFHFYDKDFNRINSFEEIENPDYRLPYYTDGNLTCDKKRNLYYAPRYVNSIKSFNSKGEENFDIPVFNFKSNDKIMEKKGRWFSPAKDVRRASGDIYVLDERLIVGYSDSKYIESKFIDIYDKNNGEYKYSIKALDKFTEFALNDNYITFFVLDKQRETHLMIYSYNKLLLE